MQLHEPLILIFSPATGEKRTNSTRRIESLSVDWFRVHENIFLSPSNGERIKVRGLQFSFDPFAVFCEKGILSYNLRRGRSDKSVDTGNPFF
jgi:hypothetical protein